jgi:hypothetical protein
MSQLGQERQTKRCDGLSACPQGLRERPKICAAQRIALSADFVAKVVDGLREQ